MGIFKWVLGVALLMALILAACGPGEAPEEMAESAEPEGADMAMADGDCPYGEAPMLAEQVAAGTLPGVCERLPVEPLVLGEGLAVDPDWVDVQIGDYGGEIIYTLIHVETKEPPVITDNRAPKIQAGGLYKNVEISDDYTEVTFTLRAGHKWSDGMPMTTDDAVFAVEDVLQNDDLYPAMPNYLVTGGVMGGAEPSLEVVDDFTFKLVFPEPYKSFEFNFTGLGVGYYDLLKPKHHMAQYHEAHGDADAIAAMVAEEGLETWVDLFNQTDMRMWQETQDHAIGFPQLNTFLLTEHEGDRYTMVRNPYYYVVDTAGNQLPYPDGRKYVNIAFTSKEQAELLMFSRQAHYHWQTDLTVLPLIMERQEEGNYTNLIYPNKDSRVYYLNLSYDDPGWRGAVWNPKFREALQVAIDSQELLDELYFGQGSLPSTQTAVYDPDLANALLDEAGMSARDEEGFRLGPDGEEFEIFITLDTWGGYFEQAPFLKDYFEDVGLRTDFQQFEVGINNQTRSANEHKSGITWNTAPLWHSHNPSYPEYLPNTNSGPLFQAWYQSDGERGEEPPEFLKDFFNIQENLAQYAFGTPEFLEWETVRNDWIYDNNPFFTFIEQPGIYHLFSNCLGNVVTGPVFHHGSWTSHKLLYIKSGCEMN
jgi:peptide/nickel transport system substrate-binding protein